MAPFAIDSRDMPPSDHHQLAQSTNNTELEDIELKEISPSLDAEHPTTTTAAETSNAMPLFKKKSEEAPTPVAADAAQAAGPAVTTVTPSFDPKTHINDGKTPYPLSKLRFVLIFMGIIFSVFLFALDQLIVATALGPILNEFNSLTKLSWLANGFFITMLAFNMAYAQWLTIFPSKTVMLFAIFMFEIGSLVCGVAPSMDVLILGRAIAGLGASGIFTSAILILAEIADMASRAKLMGLVGIAFAAASVLGPLVGGAFSDHVSWRWCFYINLPIGGVAGGFLALLLPHQPPLGRHDTYKGYGKHMFMQLLKCDWVGVGIILGWAVCVILPLQYGGVTKAWSDGSVIAMLVLIPVLFGIFILWEWYLGFEKAMVPLALLRRRTIWIVATISPLCWAVFMLVVYYLSEGYQAVYHTSATGAGVRLLPLIMVQIVILIASGRFVAKFGWIKPLLVVGPACICLGCGLLYSVNVNTSQAHIMGYQAIIAFGTGMFIQNAILLAQYEVRTEPRLISKASGIGTFSGFIGRIIGISVAGAVFTNKLQSNLATYAPDLPAVYKADILSDATAVWTAVPDAYRPDVIVAYVKTLSLVYVIGVPFAGVAFFVALFLPNQKMVHAAPGAGGPPKGPGGGEAKGHDIEEGSVNTATETKEAEVGAETPMSETNSPKQV